MSIALPTTQAAHDLFKADNSSFMAPAVYFEHAELL
jgi:hypothetical protein